MENKAFELFLKGRSVAEGGYSDYRTEAQDPANQNDNITVRGVITPTYEVFLKSKGITGLTIFELLERQIAMMLPAGQAPANVDFLKVNKVNYLLKSAVPLEKSRYIAGYMIPSLSEQERQNPTNQEYIDFMRWATREVNANLYPSLQYIFANLYFAGGHAPIFPDTKEYYSWAGGFKEWIKRKLGINVSGSSYKVSDDEAKVMNAREIDIINEIYPYSKYRFEYPGLNKPEALERYRKGWLNGASVLAKNAQSLAKTTPTSAQKTTILKQNAGDFYAKNKVAVWLIGFAVLALGAFLGYKLWKKHRKRNE